MSRTQIHPATNVKHVQSDPPNLPLTSSWHSLFSLSPVSLLGGNIGNAEVEGLSKTLNILPDQYNWCLTVFFFTYAAFEIPSNLLLKKLRPSRWLPTIMVAWGLVMMLMGFVQSYHGLLIARLFLGVAEAGLFPGVMVSFFQIPPFCFLLPTCGSLFAFMFKFEEPGTIRFTDSHGSCAQTRQYYLTMWYCRHEIQFRQALFFSAASIAGAFSGLLAFAIGKMNGAAGLEGWRWIFILEGVVTILVACSAYFLIHDFPDTASFLTEEERTFVVHRLENQDSMRVDQDEAFKWLYVWQMFGDWQVWVFVLVFLGVSGILLKFIQKQTFLVHLSVGEKTHWLTPGS